MTMKAPCFAGAMLLGLLVLPAGATGIAAPAAGQAAAQPGTATHTQSFESWLNGPLTDAIKTDPKYHRIPLATHADTTEYLTWMMELWSQQITPVEFKQRVDQKYPGHEYEADFVITHLPPVAQRAAVE